jgi:hypothetical protein
VPKPKPLPDREEWRQIPGWEGYYEASNFGRVRSVDRVIEQYNRNRERVHVFYPGRLLAQRETSFGYLEVGLCRNNKVTWRRVHQLVCAAFHGEAPPTCEVGHRNGQRKDNFASNLRWMTKLENAADRIAHDRHMPGERHANHKLTEQAVTEILAARPLAYGVASSLGRKFGVHSCTIRRVAAGAAWRHRQ